MAKDPAFLFYPGDYLKDTQCLSEAAQVAYDRIMCEHMRNISEDMNNIAVTKERVDFFTKRLTEDQKADVYHVLSKIKGGFQIQWVAESICKRAQYGISRAKNRSKRYEKDMNHTSFHTAIEIENAIENTNTVESTIKGGKKKNRKQFKPPTIDDVVGYFKSKGYSEEVARRAYDYYDELQWHDKNGDKINNWKSKMISVWFKPENKIEAGKKKKDDYSFI